MTYGRFFLMTMATAVWVALGAAPAAGSERSNTSGDAGQPFRTVVSLGPLITDMIYSLGAEQRLLGVTRYCTVPEGGEPKQIIGTVIQINVEKIVSLRPDAVFASTLTRVKQVEALKKQGIHVIQYGNPADFKEICDMFLSLGTLLGKKQRALAVIETARAGVAEIQSTAARLEKRKVFIQIGVKPLRTSEQGTFISNYIELAGGINIAGPVGTGIFSREQVLMENPDVILVATMGSSTKAAEAEKARWMSFKPLKAVQNKEIHVLDAYIVCSPTPETFVEGLTAFFNCIHPGVAPGTPEKPGEAGKAHEK